VTRFHGDWGFAVGVNCNLLLCDPLSLAPFLLSWARTHAEIKAQNRLAINPWMQYACYFQRPDARAVRALVKTTPLDDGTPADDSHATETVLFRASAGVDRDSPDHLAIAGFCLFRASERMGAADKAPSQFSVMFGDGRGGMSIEAARTADDQPASGGGQYKAEAAQWKELGLEELVLRDSKPVHVSYNIIVTGGDEGLAIVMPEGTAGDFLVTATVAK
jgi:hypothetical protein